MAWIDPFWIILAYWVCAWFLWGGAQKWVRTNHWRYSMQDAATGWTGCRTAEALLDAAGVQGVDIGSVGGVRTDHYDVVDRKVRLSEDVLDEASVHSVAVAAHEAGHAVQHAKGSWTLRVRTLLFRPMAFLVWLSLPVLFAGLALDELGQSAWADVCFWSTVALMHGGVALAGSTVLVELDASRRALGTLQDLSILEDREMRVAGVILAAAAGTYVASAAMASADSALFGAHLASRSPRRRWRG